MKLMPPAEVPAGKSDLVFRHSPARAVIAALGTLGAGGALAAYAGQQHPGLAYYLAGVLVLGALVMRRFVLARFGPSNWLARVNDEGVFLHIRSYLNDRLPAQDATVAFIPFREIRSARRVDVRREIPERDLERPRTERTTVQRRRLVELELGTDTAALAQAVDDERGKRPPSGALYRHYPVRVPAAGRIQVEWDVAPGVEVFLNALSRRTHIAAPEEVSRDFAGLERLSREEQHARLLELADSGQTVAAVTLARKLYGLDLVQARNMVEELRAGAGGAGAKR